MDWVCPICNGLTNYVVKCPNCGNHMEERGAIQDYFDDYSPYLSKNITQQVDGTSYNKCIHLFYCPICNKDKRIVISEIQM